MYFDRESIYTACIICKGLLIFLGNLGVKKLATLLKVIKFIYTKTFVLWNKIKTPPYFS